MSDPAEARLTKKTAFITGGGNGIGREIVLTFSRYGARIFSMDIDGLANEETARMVREQGGQCECVQGDASVAADVERAFKVAGSVDILVNNAAAWSGDGWLHEVSEADWDRVIAVCLRGTYLCTRAALKSMRARKAGSIINISSVNALTGIHLAAYTAAKGGINSLTRLLALQYAPYGIRVNAICPGTIVTDSTRRHYDEHPEDEAEILSLYPGKHFGEPADIAHCALYMASDEARFMNGSIVVVDGAMSSIHRIPSLHPNS
ncbi:MAG TPA: SDR family NAD(P)-dependent oxidoreductase [Terriglobia bacterium]|nr:SDR family NAD(P)-dependent oxidoreductase [Terriglobia bacterium]